MAVRKLEVYLHNQKAGILTDVDGELSFKYDDNGGKALSVRLPVRKEEYGDKACRPFFENLLPEGNIREAVARKELVSESNVFSLLDKIGGDCAGAVSLYEEGPAPKPGGEKDIKEITDEELYDLINNQAASPLLTGKNIRLSLAGAQHKFAIYIKLESTEFL